LFRPRTNNRARHSRTEKKIKRVVWQCCKATDENSLKVFCFAPQPRLKYWILFFTLPLVPVTLVASRTFSIPSCLSHCKLTSQLVLARSPLAKIICGAQAVASGSHCSCAPYTSQPRPASPSTAARARL
jgi:hypothetical protein